MKKYLFFVAAAALMAACSSDDLAENKAVVQNQDEQAVEFGAYVNRGVTRAGETGELVTAPTSGKADLQTQGFGVFGYYTNNELYSEASKPNFFYNQKVSGAGWTYSPIKYWPNEFGSDAISDAQDKLTFFAYAPWVDVEPSTGLLKDQSGNNSGIVALTRNTASGDPFVKYFVDMNPANRVDLCWGVAKSNFNSSVAGSLNNILEGKPYKDVSKPEVASKINFDFNHALASLNVQIDADIDMDIHDDTPLASGTKIFVRSVTFEGFASKGMFNLNADKNAPKWYDLTGINELTNGKVTIYDGRRDGSEGQINAEASNETPKDLNPVIIQDYAAAALSSSKGVPSGTAPVNLFNSATLTEPVYVIPTGEQLKVTIVYDVETEDANLAAYLSDGKTKGSSVENTITKAIFLSDGTTDLKLSAGKKYTVKLHLGMTSVKFEASVTDWEDGDEGEPWLPINNGTSTSRTVAATSAPYASFDETVPATASTVTFNLTGLTGTETITRTAGGFVNTSWITAPDAADGATTVSVAIPANTTTSKKTGGSAQAVGGTSSKGAIANITQEPHPLELAYSSAVSSTITVTTSAELTDGFATNLSGATITVVETSATETNLFSSVSGLVITTSSALTTGKQYKVTVTANDVTESITFTMP